MPKAPIKRPVVKLDTSNQLGLFSPQELAEMKPTETPVMGVIRFTDPDPRQILLNGVRLDQHLRDTGETVALKVRGLLEQQDWSEFELAYKAGGRPPYAPRGMTGLILYGIMRGVTSLRDLERFARVDLGCMWISGGIYPDHSIIGRFIQRHEQHLSEAFFVALTGQVLKLTGSDLATVSGDGTVVEAAASRYRVMKEEALKQAMERTREGAAADPERADAKLAQLNHAAEVLQHRKAAKRAKGKNADKLQIHPSEPEAVIQRLKDKKRFAPAYKPSVLANAVRIIVAQDLDASSETAVVAGLLAQAQRQGAIQEALFDAGYHCKTVLDATKQQQIGLLCPEGQSQGDDWTKQSEKYYPKNRFDYDPDQDRYTCPQGEALERISAYKGNEHYSAYVLYGTKACADCEQRDHCTQNVKGRRIKRYAEDDAKDELRKKMEIAENRERYLKRQGMVEPVFSYLKCRQGLSRFRRKGLKAVRCEFALHAMAYNLSRAVALTRPDVWLLFKAAYRFWIFSLRQAGNTITGWLNRKAGRSRLAIAA